MINNTDMKEISYAQKLSHVENSVRLKALKKLQRLINYKSSIEGFTCDDLMIIWKGLYCCMYMADKPLAQENLADDIAKLIEEFKNSSQIFLFIEAAFETFVREWNGIDKFRMDKFMMLFTRFLRQSLVYLKQNKWNMDEVGKFVKLMETIIICPTDGTNSKPLGLKMHLTDILLDELAKVGRERLPNDVTITFLYPFFKVLVVCKQVDFIKYVESKIFGALVRMSDVGIQNHDDLAIGEFEVVKEGEDNEEFEEVIEGKEPLDPRAGGVDVYIPQIRPNYVQIADILTFLGGITEINQSKRNLLYKYVNIFLDIEMGVYPYPKFKGIFETSGQNSNGGLGIKKECRGHMEDEEESSDINSFRKLKLGNNSGSIKKNKRVWNRLQKKSDEEKRKEVKKGNFNSEFAVNKVFLHLAVHKKIPNNFYVTSGPLQNIVAKKRKNKSKKKAELAVVNNSTAKPDNLKSENNQVSLTNKAVVPCSPEISKQSSVEKKRKSKISKTSKNLSLHSLKDKKKSCSNNMQEIQNLNSTGINVFGKKFDEAKLSKPDLTVSKEGKFETKYVNGDALVESPFTLVEAVTISGQVEKPSDKKRRNKIRKRSSLNNCAIENAEQCISKNHEKKKKNIFIEEFQDGNPKKNKLTVNKKAKFESEDVKLPKVNVRSFTSVGAVTGQVEKSSIKIRRRRKKFSKNSGINSLTTENAKQCSNKNKEEMKKNIFSGEFHDISNKANVTGNVKHSKAKSSPINMVIKAQKVNTKGKLLKINLRQNTVHDVVHYRKILSASPGIPFSANKKPQASVLKATPPTNRRKKPKKLKRLQELARKF